MARLHTDALDFEDDEDTGRADPDSARERDIDDSWES